MSGRRKAKAWGKKLQALANEIPDGVWLFAADGGLHVMVSGKDGLPMMDGGGFSQRGIAMTVDVPTDGGDW